MKTARVDANQPAMVAGLRELGFVVEVTHQLPKFVDFVMSGYRRLYSKSPNNGAVWRGEQEEEPRVLIVEVKQPGKRGNLTPAEEKLADRWKGHAYIEVEYIDEILQWYGWVE